MLNQPILPLQLGNSKYPDSHVVQPNPIWFVEQTENENACMCNAKTNIEAFIWLTNSKDKIKCKHNR